MKILFTTTLAITALALTGCGEEKSNTASKNNTTEQVKTQDNKPATKTKKPSKKTSKKSSKNVLQANITGFKQWGPSCSVLMEWRNKTGKEINLIQIMKYTAISQSGKQSGQAPNFDLEDGESTDRNGLFIENTKCTDLREIKIEEMYCWYDGWHTTLSDEFKCEKDTMFRGKKRVEFIH